MTKTLFSHDQNLQLTTNGGSTLYFKAGTIAVVPAGNNLKIGFALCSPKDEFARRKGRLIAEGRAKKALQLGVVDGNTCLGRHTLDLPAVADETPLQCVNRAWSAVTMFVFNNWA